MFIFAAFPSSAPTVANIINAAAVNFSSTEIYIHPWPENDVMGRPLIEPILDNIDKSDFVICDISRLNFNVIFEVGYAIGKKKKILVTINDSVSNDAKILSNIGIFDTIGYSKYNNTEDFMRLVDKSSISSSDSMFIDYKKDSKVPVYIVELPKKTDVQTRIESRIKKARLKYRTFNQQEHVRLSAISAIEAVSSSSGVIVPLASQAAEQADIHNIRAAFVAGLAWAMNRPLLMLQEADGPAPLDVRDAVKTFRELDGINPFIAAFADEVVEEMQAESPELEGEYPALAEIVLGDPMAENEMTTLGQYFLVTDEFLRVSRGEANVVVGRKGMGKTALFIRTRDKNRKVREKIVVDLKPEGYQLKKLREDVFEIITDASVDHLIVAFWEYLLYIEICNKILEKDEKRANNDHILRPLYQSLSGMRDKVKFADEGDFSERLYALVQQVTQSIDNLDLSGKGNRLSTENVTEIIQSYQLPELRAEIIKYLYYKDSVWILFDNLDKGWPTHGIEQTDVVILRALIDASKKIKRELNREDIEAHAIVFVRNDVYELLVEESSDFGKEIRVHLDWSDVDQLKRLVLRRLSESENSNFDKVWEKYVSRLVNGEHSFDYIVERSLYRPRNLVKIIYSARGLAVNARSKIITESNIIKAIAIYSHDVLEEADEELSDIIPKARGLLYKFIGEPASFSRESLLEIVGDHAAFSDDEKAKVVQALLYYGFIGIQEVGAEPRYIYNFSYKMKLLEAWMNKHSERKKFVLNPAFWEALEVVGTS
jgi:hypothetical protein